MLAIHQVVRTRPRLIISIIAGIGIGLVVPSQWDPVGRALIAWNVTVWSYLCLMGWLMMRASHAKVRMIAEQEDKSAIVILAIMSIAAIVSIAAIILELATVKELALGSRMLHYVLTCRNRIRILVTGCNPVYISLCPYLL